MLYIVLFLHQTATIYGDNSGMLRLYIVLFLHQTATEGEGKTLCFSCISFYSYIKPQLFSLQPTRTASCISFYSYIKPQLYVSFGCSVWVVYRSIPTSNRNLDSMPFAFIKLYIVLFLHQTATLSKDSCAAICCISFYSYIKPQRQSA